MDLIREAPIGQFIRYLTSNRVLLYPEEQPGYVLPTTYQAALGEKDSAFRSMVNSPSPSHLNFKPDDSPWADPELAPGTVAPAITPRTSSDGTILVDWYSDYDAANPLNWSSAKRTLVVTLIVGWLPFQYHLLFVLMCRDILSACIPLSYMQDPQYIRPGSSV